MDKLSYVWRRHGSYLDIEFNRLPSKRVRAALKDLGYVYLAKIKSWRGRSRFNDALNIAETAIRNSAHGAKFCGYKGDTLCWDCAKAGYGNLSECPWERDFKPVDGWKAERFVRQHDYGHDKVESETYCVISCPLFVPDPRSVRKAVRGDMVI